MSIVAEVDGNRFEFPDGTSEDVITSEVQKYLKPMSTMDVLSAVPAVATAGLGKTLGGGAKLLGDITGWEGASTFGENVRAASDAAVAEAVPSALSMPQEMLLSGVSSVAQMAPYLVGGVGAGIGRMALGATGRAAAGTAANVAIGGASIGEGLAEYGEQRAAGMSGPRAAAHATIQGLAEYIPERLAFAPITQLLTLGKAPTAKIIGQFLGRDIVGEEVTTLIEDINAKLSRRPDLTFAEYLHDAAVTAGSTLISGPIQAGLGAGVARLAAPIARAVQPKVPDQSLPVQPILPPSTEPTGNPAAEEGISIPGHETVGWVLGPQGELIDPSMQNTPPAELPFEQRLALYTQLQNRTERFSEDAVTKVHNDLLIRDLQVGLFKEAANDPAKLHDLRIAGLEAGEAITPDIVTDIFVAKEQRAFANGFVEPPITELAPETETAFVTNDFTTAVRTEERLAPIFLNKLNELAGESFDMNGVTGRALVQTLQTAPAGSVTVLHTAPVHKSVDVQATPILATKIAPVLESWTKTFLPQYKIALQVFDTTENLGSTTMGGPDLLIMRIKSDQVDDAKWFTTVAHEFGHLLHYTEYAKAAPEVKRALYSSYASDLNAAVSLSPVEGMQLLQSPLTAFRWGARLAKEGETTAEAVTKYGTGRWGTPTIGTNKLASFNEWLAERSVRYFATRGGVTPQTEGFFKKMVRRLAELFQYGYKQVDPGAAFTKFMDDIIAKNPAAQVVDQAAIDRMKAELVAEGIHPAVIASLQAPGTSFDFQLGQRLVDSIRQAPVKDVEKVRDVERRAALSVDTVLSQLKTWASTKKSKNMFAEFRRLGLNPELLTELEQDVEFAGKPKLDRMRFFHKLVDRAVPLRVERLGNVITLSTKLGGQVVFKGEFVHAQGTQGPVVVVSNIVSIPDFNTASFYQLMRIAGAEGADMVYLEKGPTSKAVMTRFGGELITKGTFEDYVGVETPVADNGTLFSIDPAVFDDPVAPGMSYSPATGLSMLTQRLNLKGETAGSMPLALGKFNNMFRWLLGPFQIAKLNIDIPGVSQYLDGLRNRMGYRSRWHSGANDVLDTWAFRMPKDQAAKVSRLLFDEDRTGEWRSVRTENPDKPGEYIFRVNADAQKEYGLQDTSLEVYSQVRNMLTLALDEFHKVGYIDTARAEFGADSPVVHALQDGTEKQLRIPELRQLFEGMLQQGSLTTHDRIVAALDALDSAFAEQRAKPYMMHPRFGQWAVIVRGGDGATIYYETFESRREQRAAFGDIAKRFPEGAVSAEYIEDVPYALQGMPPQLLDAIARNLDLSPEQLSRYKDQLKALSPSSSFLHNLRRRKGVEGYTEDAVRGFADYFRRMGNYISRVKSGPELAAALDVLKKFTDGASRGGDADVTTLRRLHESLQDHIRYLSSPKNEMGELKSFVSMFYFFGNISSAVMNAMQVPAVTLPYLSSRFGTLRTLSELKTAYADVLGKWFKVDGLPADEQEMIQHALDSGFLNESFQTTMAQLAEGGALMRAQPVTKARQMQNTFNHYGMLMFQKAEELNRRVTMLATYRMNRGKSFVGAFDKEAFAAARAAVEDTQNEYAIENRPRFMRGNASVMFQFMHFTQNMVFQMFGGDLSWKRLLLAQLALGGMLGMPFAEDIEDLLQYLARAWFGKDFDLERNAREFLKDMGVNSDLVLRGMTSNVLGFDLSKRVSLGQIIPGVPALASSQDFNDALSAAVGDVGGAGFSTIINAMKAIGSDNPDQLKRWGSVMPSAVRNGLRAFDAGTQGEVTSAYGAKLAGVDTLDALGMAAGFAPAQVTSAQRVNFERGEIATYWLKRRQAVMDEYAYVVLDRGSDREALADVMERIAKFNSTAPDPKLRIGVKTLKTSIKNRYASRTLREAGYGTNPSTRILSAEVTADFASP